LGGKDCGVARWHVRHHEPLRTSHANPRTRPWLGHGMVQLGGMFLSREIHPHNMCQAQGIPATPLPRQTRSQSQQGMVLQTCQCAQNRETHTFTVVRVEKVGAQRSAALGPARDGGGKVSRGRSAEGTRGANIMRERFPACAQIRDESYTHVLMRCI
jgi:hypothetical protein